ncbi:HNH endonuclease [Bradyrhizobium sp. 156]|uniref:HNH endonuclease n=1 Tax=Bradyrhizobium sp. 156 TaxID=2782630 RepID=UPI001FFB5232|nr:HNH endonuclease [Bradyrhizobium sp. 156]MCK1322118.1 HNH endonuclease [Bradyrhizobium sp. 156]
MKPNLLTATADAVRAALDYNPATGAFIRKASRSSSWIGSAAGFVHRTGYLVIKIGNRPYMAQRLAWVHFYGQWPDDFFVDHVNRNKLDNRICNLRLATNGQNVANSRTRAISGRKGVYPAPRMPGKWQAQINIAGKTTNIGIYDNVEDAALAYGEAARSRYGEFAKY